MFRPLAILQLLIIAVVLLVSCGGKPFPPDVNDASYPAEISGNVTIPAVFNSQAVRVTRTTPITVGGNFWVVTASFKNIDYAEPEYVFAVNWEIVTEEHLYPIAEGVPWDDTKVVNRGETVTMTLAFMVPHDLTVNDAVLRYYNGDKVSYGALSGGHYIPNYNWETKSTLPQAPTSKPSLSQ